MGVLQLSDRTVLANFSVSRWGGQRVDKRVTDDVHKQNDMASDSGQYNKRLLPKGATSKIDAIVNAARDYHREHTMPWLDGGTRILPATLYMDYAGKMRDFRVEYFEEVEAFVGDFPTLVKQDRTRLGKRFNEADYPTPDQLRAEYSWFLDILPFPDRVDFRIPPDLIGSSNLEEIKSQVQERMESVYKDAMADTGTRITEVVGRMAERLKAYKPGKPGKRAENTFKDSLVDNVRELAGLLPAFNLTNDKKLGKIIDQMQKELCRHDADLLRDDDKIRRKVAASADAVLTAVADFIA